MGERENKERSPASVCAPPSRQITGNGTSTQQTHQPPRRPRQDEVDEVVKKYFFTRATPPGQDEVDDIVQKYFFSGDEDSVKSAPAKSLSQRDVDTVVQKYLFSKGTSSSASVDGGRKKDHRRYAGTAEYFGSTPESRPLADGGGGGVAHNHDWSSMSRGKLKRMGGGGPGHQPPNKKKSSSSGGVVVDLNRHTIPETECVAPQVEYVRVVQPSSSPADGTTTGDADDEARDQPCSHGPHHLSSQTFEIGEVGDDVSIDESCAFSISFSVSQQQQNGGNQHRRTRGSVDLCTVGDEEEDDDELECGGCSLEEAEGGGETTPNGGGGRGCGARADPAGGGGRRLGLRDQIHRFSSGMMSSYTSLGRQRTSGDGNNAGCCAAEGDFEPDGEEDQPPRTKFDHSFFLEARFVPRSCVLLVIGVALIVAAAALTMHHASSPPPTPSLGDSNSDDADDGVIVPPSSTKNVQPSPPQHHHHVGASVMELLSQITPVDTLEDPDAPQRHAMRWIIEEENALDLDGYVVDLDDEGPDTIERLAAAEQSILEHYAVATLFYSTTDRTGMGWFAYDNWLSEVSVCDWYGVTCDVGGRLTQLRLPGNGLRGHIPEEIGALRSVELIDLSKNEITGSVPDGMGQLNHLTELYLQANHLEGTVPPPLCDGDLPHLNRFSADCLGDERRVDCPCCTECFFFGT